MVVVVGGEKSLVRRGWKGEIEKDERVAKEEW